jgi:hypothetical protein
VVNFIEISVSKRKERSKVAEIEEAYRIRDIEILTYEWKNPFSYFAWHEAWKCGWLRQHGLNIHSFPSPVLHHKKMWKKSNNPFFKSWREESREKHQIFLQELRGER